MGVEVNEKPLILTFSVFMALLLCGCTSYCYGKIRERYGNYVRQLFYVRFLKYNPDGAAVSHYKWDGDPEKIDIVIPEKYGKQR